MQSKIEYHDDEPTIIRIATFNVHGWTTGGDGDSFDKICQTFKSTTRLVDILGLQEAPRSRRLEKLGMQLYGENNYYIVAWNTTAIVSRYPLLDLTIPSAGGRHCRVRVKISKNQVWTLTVVHLDHRKEPCRCQEIMKIVSAYENDEDSLSSSLPTIWMGDFNALSREDYSIAEWRQITQVRALNNWELPQTDVTSIMTGSRMAYDDIKNNNKKKQSRKKKSCFSAVFNLRDAYREAATDISGPPSTCRFDTRIDYIYFDSLQPYDVVQCQHIDMIKQRLSDHNAVVATFERCPIEGNLRSSS